MQYVSHSVIHTNTLSIGLFWIGPSQRHLPDNTQHSQQTCIHAPTGFEPTIARHPRLRLCARWDRHYIHYIWNRVPIQKLISRYKAEVTFCRGNRFLSSPTVNGHKKWTQYQFPHRRPVGRRQFRAGCTSFTSAKRLMKISVTALSYNVYFYTLINYGLFFY